MPIDFEDITDSLRRIRLSGRMDIQGTDEIGTQFAALAATAKHRIVVDMTAVTFLSSIGIRALVSNAKAQQLRGGRFVLFVGENTEVSRTLQTTGIDTVIPMFTDAGKAEGAALD
jgi:anti-anti-sigma factor